MTAMPKTSLLRAITLTFFATLLALPATAATWLAIESKSGAQIEVDTASLERSDGKLRIWYRESYATPQIPDSGAFSFTSLTVRSEFQCAKYLAAPLRRTYFARNGSEIKTENYDGKDVAPVTPDSASEAVFSYACKQKEKVTRPPVKKVVVPPLPPVLPPEPTPAPKKSKSAKAVVLPDAEWTYEGKAGANQWGKLSADYAKCGSGERQSPIDIRDTISADLPPIRFSYTAVPLSIVDNGHTIQVNVPDAGSITLDGEEYELLQFHFHKPSEEKVNGKNYDMVAHLVHKSRTGKLAVVAILLQAGAENKLIRTLWNNLPLEQDAPVNKADVNIDPTLLLPTSRSYFAYAGSLTTPPCSEGVLWLVLKVATPISSEQISSFGKIYKNNARPIQPSHGRVIKASR